MRCKFVPTVVMAGVWRSKQHPAWRQRQGPAGKRQAEPPRALLGAPVTAEPVDPAGLGPAKLDETDRALPINLATALRLADARPLVIEAARAAVQAEVGLYNKPASCGCRQYIWAWITSATTAPSWTS